MKVDLKEFQGDAVRDLLQKMCQMRDSYERYGQLSAVSLTAPTGSGKTVMASAAIESLFFGNPEEGVLADEKACILWLSDSPSLNDQTRARFVDASDKLADWMSDERHLETVTNTFGASHEMFEPRHVYFMSKDLLGKGNLLVKGGEENSGRIFWDILDRSIASHDLHLYLFIDEAHRGLGSNKTDNNNSTIYANLIDGFENRAPMPVVVGISATPKRFESAMASRNNRTLLPAVTVTAKQVQESGLLKDTVVLRVPEQDDPVEHQYLDFACDRLNTAEKSWADYCAQEGIPAVKPLLVVQVRDKIGDEALAALCDQICDRVRWLDARTAFANVFGEHSTLMPSPKYPIPYIEPQLVEQSHVVRVLFAKEAISNGWDCPRAEVIFSQRRRSDYTYIAQLIGRMVRTPLARRIDADESLNSVACYLPQFDPDATESVIDYLTGKTDDLGGSIVDEVVTNPETVVWGGKVFEEHVYDVSEEQTPEPANLFNQPQLERVPSIDEALEETSDDSTPSAMACSPSSPSAPSTTAPTPVTPTPASKTTAQVSPFTKEDWDGIEKAFASLRKRVAPKKARNEFVSLNQTTTLMMKTGLDTSAGENARTEFCNQLDGAIVAYPKEYEEQKHIVEVAEMAVIILDKRNDNTITQESESPKNDTVGIQETAREAERVFGGKEFVNAYRKHLYTRNINLPDIDLILASASRTEKIVDALEKWAESARSKLFDTHATDRDFLSETDRQEYDRLLQETSGIRDIPVEFPNKMEVSGDFKRFPKHVIFNPEDGMCPIKFEHPDGFEVHVLERELKRDRTVAFYRNPSNNSPQVFSIPYTMPDGRRALRPDFIFFVRDPQGTIRPSIVDPHGSYLSDALPKLKGYVNYLRDYPKEFLQVLSVTDFSNTDELRMLNLLDPRVQDAILNFTGDHVNELYLGGLSEHYGTFKS